MNRRSQKISGSEGGSALLAALCFCAVLGIALASYMSVCSQTLQLSNRNSQGTHSLELAETGMEEILWTLNKTKEDKSEWSSWTLDNASSPKTATKALSGFSFGNGVTGSATLTVENYDDPSPLVLRKLKITGQTTLADGSTVTRKLQASAQQAPLFVNAIASLSTSVGNGISFANSAVVNSFDSLRFGADGDLDGDGIANKDDDDMDGDGKNNMDDDDIDGDGIPNAFDGDLYGPTTGFSAVVSSATNIILTNAQIDGYVRVSATPDGAPRLSYSSGVRVAGPSASSSFTGVDPARLSTSPYQPAFEIKVPSATSAALNGAMNVGNQTHTEFYFTDDLILSNGQVLTVDGPVVLEVKGNLKIQGSGQIVVTSRGSIEIVLSGQSSELSIGGMGIKNVTERPKNVAIFDAAGSPSRSPEISTSQPFYGVVYAPKSDHALIVSSELEFYGALVAKNVSITGIPSIHYDVDLRRIATKFSCIDTPFVVSAWQEITP